MKLKTAPPSQGSSRFERLYVRPKPGRTLIVGSRVYQYREDRRKKHKEAIGLDMLSGDGVDLVADLEEELPDIGLFDHVECMSVLEHSRKPWLMAENIQRLMVKGGTIYLTVPFCWRPHAYPSDYWRMTPEGVSSIFPEIEWEALLYSHLELTDSPKIPSIVKDHRYMARTETVGFGRKC